MNKKTKGIVAGAAGAAILLGTAGTFALWSTSADVDGGVVTGGTFALTGAEDMTWQEQTLAGAVLASSTDSEITLVPGVQLVGTSVVGVDLAGDHLVATLTGAATGEPVPDWLDVTWLLGDVEVGSGSATNLTPLTASSQSLSVVISLVNQDGDQDGSDVAGEVWTADGFTITLQQVAPSAT